MANQNSRQQHAVNSQKFSAITNLTYLLHVVAGTVAVVAIRNNQKDSYVPELDSFLRKFLLTIEIFAIYSISVTALAPPNNGGTLQTFLLMLFNGVSSHFYIELESTVIFIMWICSAFFLLIASSLDQEHANNEVVNQDPPPPMENQDHYFAAVNSQKFSAITNLTYFLHVVAGTVVVVAIRNNQKNSYIPELDSFLHKFLLTIEIFAIYSISVTALAPPNNGGTLQTFILMLFNGFSSQLYITIKSKELDFANVMFIMWLGCASLFLIVSFIVSLLDQGHANNGEPAVPVNQDPPPPADAVPVNQDPAPPADAVPVNQDPAPPVTFWATFLAVLSNWIPAPFNFWANAEAHADGNEIVVDAPNPPNGG